MPLLWVELSQAPVYTSSDLMVVIRDKSPEVWAVRAMKPNELMLLPISNEFKDSRFQCLVLPSASCVGKGRQGWGWVSSMHMSFLLSLPMSLNSPPCRRRIPLLPSHIAGVILDTGAICAHRQQQQAPPRQEVDCHRRPCQGSPDRRPQLQLVLGNVPHTGYTLTLHTRYHSCAHLVRRRLDSPAVHLSIALVVWHCHMLEPFQ